MQVSASVAPISVVYCHCIDCRRWCGGPVSAFAAFKTGDLRCSPPLGPAMTGANGVERWFCKACGSSIAARFDYLPDQIYVALGIIDQADQLAPQLHCHWNSKPDWLRFEADGLPRHNGSARSDLNAAG